MLGLLLLVAAAALGAAIFLALEELSHAESGRRAALAQARTYGRTETRELRGSRRAARGAAVELWLARLSLRVTPRRSEAAVAERLLAAGLGGRISAAGFLAVEVASAGGFGVAAVGLAAASEGSAVSAIAIVLCAAAVGFLLPRFVVGAHARRRVERVEASLPDALDLLAVAVSAGLGLDGAIARLADSAGGPLAEELAVVMAETRVGEGRRQALQRMAARLDSPTVSALVRALVQGEQLGVSLGETLRTQAAEARRRRRASTEERASKTPVKMLVPTALFIFPALFVVILGPAILNIGEVF